MIVYNLYDVCHRHSSCYLIVSIRIFRNNKNLLMKKMYVVSLLLGIALAAGNQIRAQIVMPDLSPYATIGQNIGFTEIRIEYSRPSVRGRVVFGDLVPYGKVWRVGANASTKIYVRDTVTV